MKVSSTGNTGTSTSVRNTKSAKGAGGDFKVGKGASAASGVAGASAASSVETLGALIALQGDGGGRGKLVAAARRALDILDDVQLGILNGRIHVRDLQALADAASAKSDSVSNDDDAELGEIYDQISLRARVELAKLGH